MIALARAKINWALSCEGFLPGGYHALDMLMESVSLCDRLDLREADGLSLTVNGAEAGEENLVMRAALALRSEAKSAPGARMALEKRIPARAGLGGGSADCAAALAGLNRLWNLNLSREKLEEIGLALGADVPFCLRGGLCRARGRGEILARLMPQIPARLVIAMGGEGLSTGGVFAAFDGQKRVRDGDVDATQEALLRRDYISLERWAKNALYAPALELDDTPRRIIRDMYAMGAVFARMSGSGSACFGVFAGGEERICARLKEKYGFCEICDTKEAGWEILP